MTDTTGALAAALAKVQAELPTLERDRTVEVQQKNGGTYSYSYVTLGNLTEKVLPLLSKHGLAFTAFPAASTGDGKMCLRYHLLHTSGEQLTGEFPMSGEGGIQIIGGRITYARRYCLAAVIGVAADEDDESRLHESGPGTAQRRQQPAKKAATAPPAKTAARKTAASAPPPLPNEDDKWRMNDRQRGALMASFGELGITEREDRLKLASEIVGRQLSSANDLEDSAEFKKLMDGLDERKEQPFEPPAEEDR